MKKGIYVAAFTEGHKCVDFNPATPESPWAYFHGQLYHDLGCDLEGHDQVDLKYCPVEYCKIAELKEGPVLMMNITGCIPVDVHGIEKPCIGFFWPVHIHTNHYVERGLICYANDTEAIMFARDKLAKRARML